MCRGEKSSSSEVKKKGVINGCVGHLCVIVGGKDFRSSGKGKFAVAVGGFFFFFRIFTALGWIGFRSCGRGSGCFFFGRERGGSDWCLEVVVGGCSGVWLSKGVVSRWL